jgi:hypothetical protein
MGRTACGIAMLRFDEMREGNIPGNDWICWAIRGLHCRFTPLYLLSGQA